MHRDTATRPGSTALGGDETVLTQATVRYAELVALDGVSHVFASGVTSLLGPNGAGKTTMLSVLMAQRRLDSGEASVAGVPLGRRGDVREARRRIGVLPQRFGFHPRFTASEMVAYAAWLREVPRRDVRAAVRESLSVVGLDDRAGSRMSTLSGGMVRRVGIACAVVNSPRLLLLDEPAAGLDPEQRVSLRETITVLAQRSSVVVSTHHVDDVASLGGGVVVLDKGRLRFQGTVAGLCAGEAPTAAAVEAAYLTLMAS